MPNVYLQGKKISLSDQSYIGAGGEGTIYAQGGKAFKIYHDPARCIPPGKIKELATLNFPNILGPREVLTDERGNPIGFTMPFKSKTEYLCKLMTRGFCDNNGVSPKDTAHLVACMQTTLEKIHEKNILVVDYNEMNFLTNQEFSDVFHIDVDCYQTPHYPATAIMASIRDPKVQGNAWTTGSDWFSFAILACQLYIKTHPYKGRHPDLGKDWMKMMANGISIFNPATRMPPATLDLSVIPKGHRKWIERVVEHGERSKPPQPDQDITPATIPQTTIVKSTETVEIHIHSQQEKPILALIHTGAALWTITTDGIYEDQKKVKSRTADHGYQARRTQHNICTIQGEPDNAIHIQFNPILETITFEDIKGNLHEKMEATGCFVQNNRIYTTTPAGVLEITPLNLGAKPLLAKETIAQVFHQHTIFPGLIVQDILGKCTITFPTEAGRAINHKIDALNGHRILSGKKERGFAILLSEHGGKLHRTRIAFGKSPSEVAWTQEETPTQEEINFTTLEKGICVNAKDDQLEVFLDLQKTKIVEDSPLNPGQKLLSWQNQVFTIQNNQILQLKLK